MASDCVLWAQLMYSEWYNSINELKISKLHLPNTLSGRQSRGIGKEEALPRAFLK